MPKRLLPLAVLLSTVLLGAAGCTETRFAEATGDGQIRGINGIFNADDAIFLIEEQEIAQLGYKDVTNQREFDNLTYNFNFDIPILGDSDRRLATRFLDVIEDTEYTLVLAGPIGSPQIVLWERPEPEWDGTETVFEVGVGHVNTTIGTVDVYLVPESGTPGPDNALGGLAFGGQIADAERASGDYSVVITPSGDPATILFTSDTATIDAADTYTLVVFDADATITGPLSVRLIDTTGTGIELPDSRFPPTTQFVHAAFGTGAVDVVAEGNFAAPIITGQTFGQVSLDVPIAEGPESYTFAPTGNTMSLLDVDIGVAAGSRIMTVLLGAVGDLRAVSVTSERRGLSTVGLLRMTNASTNADAVDVYLTDPGIGVADQLPSVIGLPVGAFSGLIGQAPGTYDLTVTLTGEDTVAAGPVSVTLNANDVLEAIVLDTADPNLGSILVFSNTNP